MTACFGFGAGVAAAQEPDFGAPPSGQYPILFNDHHVYAKPDVDKQNRVLAALVRGKTVLVPLRSLFEQMGATVEYDPKTRTATVSKPGSEVRVTVGRAEVVINGESRPLDVPPEMYEGNILVPLRVMSEGMGAYVQWVPEKRAVVVRYIPAPPPSPPPAPPAPKPTAAPPPPPPAAPAATPAPAPTAYLEKFIIADAIGWPKLYNEFDPGSANGPGINVRGAIEAPIPNFHLMFEGQWTQWRWPHATGAVTSLGGAGSTVVPAFTGTDNNADIDFGMRIGQPRIYFIEGYQRTWNDYGYPNLSGIGFGLEKLPDLDHPVSWYGRWWYSLAMKGTFPTPAGNATLTYIEQKWLAGVTWNFGGPQSPVFLDLGYQGEGWINKANAPGNRVQYGPFAGLGVHF